MTDIDNPRPDASAPAVSAHVNVNVPVLDAERLDCYKVAVEFHALVPALLAGRVPAAMRDQLERASLSIVLNAEGAGRFSRRDKARFYATARGSSTETAAIVDVLAVRGLIDPVLAGQARKLLVRVIQMLTGLMRCPAR